MIPEIGHFSLIVAMMIALTQGYTSLKGAMTEDFELMQHTKPLALAQFILILVSVFC